MVAREPGESERDRVLRLKEERHSKVESSEEEELGPSGAADPAAPSGIGEERKEREEEKKEPLPATSAADPAASTTPAVEKTAETTSAVEKTVETKEEKENTEGAEGSEEEEESEQDLTGEPGTGAASSAAQSSSGRTIADFVTSAEGVTTGWEVRGTQTKYTPAKIDPKAPWRKKHPEPQSGFRHRSQTSLQYRKLKDLVRLQKKQGVITEDLQERIREFGKERPKEEIRLERKEQRLRNKEKREESAKRKAQKKSEAADTAEEKEEEQESPSEEETSVRLKERSRSPVRRPRSPDGPPPVRRPRSPDGPPPARQIGRAPVELTSARARAASEAPESPGSASDP